MCEKSVFLLLGLCLASVPAMGQNIPGSTQSGVPTFTGSFSAQGRQYSYAIVGHSPETGGTTVIPTVLIPVSLSFQIDQGQPDKTAAVDPSADIEKIVQSPIFQKFPFATGDTQYGDAVQRAEFYKQIASKTGSDAWHTMLGQPKILLAIRIDIPPSDGYLMTSRRTGKSLAVVDLEFVKKELFAQLAAANLSPNDLVFAVTKNTMFYPLNDATVCCSWGAYGVHIGASANGSGQPFILGTYLDSDLVPRFSDIQPLTQQLIAFFNDPLHGKRRNKFPAWQKPKGGSCGGVGVGTFYRFAGPTDSDGIFNATAVTLNGKTYRVENAALLPWFEENPHPGTFQGAYSFPNTHALQSAALPCSRNRSSTFTSIATPLNNPHAPNGHELIGYWTAYRPAKDLPFRKISPQWDVVIVAFAAPVKGSLSQLYFDPPQGETAEQFKSDIEFLQHKGKKVLISLGGGGKVVILNTAEDESKFLVSVSSIVKQYGFDGVDLDLETPSLILQPGDTDFRHPTTPSVVNLIDAMHKLRRRFGRKFTIAEVPEGPQVPAGMVTYGGQFGSFLPVIYGTRKILSFVDVQNYNTPPLTGLDGNIYLPGTSDYYVAMAEMMVHGFPVGGNQKNFFPPLPPEKVAIGFMAGPPQLPTIENALHYVIQGRQYAGAKYKLLRPSGYPRFNGAMFWNIESDRRNNYRMSNTIGPLLHNLPSSQKK